MAVSFVDHPRTPAQNAGSEPLDRKPTARTGASVPHTRAAFDLAPTRQLLQTVGNRGGLYISYPDPMYSAATLFDYQDFAALLP